MPPVWQKENAIVPWITFVLMLNVLFLNYIVHESWPNLELHPDYNCNYNGSVPVRRVSMWRTVTRGDPSLLDLLDQQVQ